MLLKNLNSSPNQLPMYVQISELLIREISAGRLLDGERLPPERDLAQSLNTTVRTLRKALAILVDKKLLERVQGSGNYIRHGGEISSIYSMFRLELPEGGGLPKADILSVDAMEKPSDLPEFGTASHATRIRRLRYLDQSIIAIEEIWLDGNSGKVPEHKLSDSLYDFYKKQLGFWINRAEDRVSIGRVPDWTPVKFGKKTGEMTGFIQRLSWANEPEPIEYSRTWFDTDQSVYIARLK